MFELSKVERVEIRERIVANLRNVDEDLAAKVADGLGLPLPEPSPTTVAVNDTLAPSPKLSILANGPSSLEGRKFGIIVTDGAAAAVLADLTGAIAAEGATFEYITPRIGGATLDDGSKLAGNQKVGGAPSVVYDVGRHRRRRGGGRRVGPAPLGEGLPHRRPRPRQVHRLDRPRSAPRRHRADRQGRRRLRRADRGQRDGASFRPRERCASGNGPCPLSLPGVPAELVAG